MILLDKKWMDVLNEDRELGRISGSNLDAWTNLYKKKDLFRKGISWHIPSQSLIDCLVEHSPIVSVGSGLGFTEKKAINFGANIVMTDIAPSEKNLWCEPQSGEDYQQVIALEAKEAILKYQDRNVFMAWPPYDNPMGFEVVSAMKVGSILVYVGEDRGGCTGNDDFFDFLEKNFKELDYDVCIPRWFGIYDEVKVYQKIFDDI